MAAFCASVVMSVQLLCTPLDMPQTYEVTAYTAGYESTGKHPWHPAHGITASGAYVEEGRTVACGPSYDFGTQFYIPHFDNVFTCEDRGGAITDRHLDIFMSDLGQALEFGRRELQAYILEDQSPIVVEFAAM